MLTDAAASGIIGVRRLAASRPIWMVFQEIL